MKNGLLYDKLTSKRHSSGFTLVELLIVIIIVGILASLILIAFNGVQGRAHDATIKTDLRNHGNKLQQYYVINGQYPPSSNLTSLELKATKGSYKYATGWNTLLFCVDPIEPGARFLIAAVSASGRVFTYSSDGGLQEFTGTWNSSAGVISIDLGLPHSPPDVWCEWAYSEGGGWHPNMIVN